MDVIRGNSVILCDATVRISALQNDDYLNSLRAKYSLNSENLLFAVLLAISHRYGFKVNQSERNCWKCRQYYAG
jgi:hypothetical protein